MSRLDNFIVWCDIQKDSHLTISRFCIGLKTDLHYEMFPLTMNYVDKREGSSGKKEKSFPDKHKLDEV